MSTFNGHDHIYPNLQIYTHLYLFIYSHQRSSPHFKMSGRGKKAVWKGTVKMEIESARISQQYPSPFYVFIICKLLYVCI